MEEKRRKGKERINEGNREEKRRAEKRGEREEKRK